MFVLLVHHAPIILELGTTCFMPRSHKLREEGCPNFHWTEKQMIPTDTDRGVLQLTLAVVCDGESRPSLMNTNRWIPVNNT